MPNSYLHGMISIRRKAAGSKTSLKDTAVKRGFLHFSQKVDYGLFILTELARTEGNEPLSLKKIAKENFLSFYFLQKVALDLRKNGFIRSVRGKDGGYVLTKSANKIQLLDILEALEGEVALMHCLRHGLDGHSCDREDDCSVRSGFGMLNEIIINTLSQFTLEDFINSKWHQKNR